MEDITDILKTHHSKNKKETSINKVKINHTSSIDGPSVSEIPDLFFDHIIPKYKLNRVEILVIMFLYRKVWCKPNLNKLHGISDIMSHEAMYTSLHITRDDLYHAIVKLENLRFIETVRAGQYFVRKFFTEDFDKQYGQTYDNFF